MQEQDLFQCTHVREHYRKHSHACCSSKELMVNRIDIDKFMHCKCFTHIIVVDILW